MIQDNGKLDFVWVVDNSGSMSQEIDQVQQSATLFFEAFNNSEADYRIGQTTSAPDGGLGWEPQYGFADLALIRQADTELAGGVRFRTVLRTLRASRAGQLAFDFRIEAAPAKVLELKARQPLPLAGLRATFEVKNLGDDQTSDALGFPLPGRAFDGRRVLCRQGVSPDGEAEFP